MPYANPEKAKAQSRIRGRIWYAKNLDYARQQHRQYALEHKDEASERGKKWLSIPGNRDKVKSREYKRLYGINLDDKKKMYDEQNGTCPICLKPLPEDFCSACVDHNHKNNKVRQLLHRKCNMLVGVEENQPGIYDRIKKYLEKHDAVC